MGSNVTQEQLDQIDQYLKGDLSESEHLAFEKLIIENKELQTEVLIQKQLFEINGFSTVALPVQTVNEKEVAHYKEQLQSKDMVDLSNKIRDIGQHHIKNNSKPKQNYYNYFIAASIALIFGAFWIFNSNAGLENYYTEHVNWQELPSFIDKGQPENDFTNGEILFKKGDYKKAIASFKKIDADFELYPYALMYIGASYDQLNENEKAIEAFDQLSNLTSFQESSRGHWYKLLIYLKQNNKDKALEMKTIILKDAANFNYTKAKNVKL